MNNIIRKIGINIFTLMRNAGLDPEDLANKLNYSYRDMCRILEGKLMLPPVEIKRIADFFQITKQELLHYRTDKVVPELQYMKEFSNMDNLNIVLDLFDEYVELVEAMTTNDIEYD